MRRIDGQYPFRGVRPRLPKTRQEVQICFDHIAAVCLRRGGGVRYQFEPNRENAESHMKDHNGAFVRTTVRISRNNFAGCCDNSIFPLASCLGRKPSREPNENRKRIKHLAGTPLAALSGVLDPTRALKKALGRMAACPRAKFDCARPGS